MERPILSVLLNLRESTRNVRACGGEPCRMFAVWRMSSWTAVSAALGSPELVWLFCGRVMSSRTRLYSGSD